MTADETRADGAPVAWTFPGQYISVTTYKRDGTGVASGKAKRIRRNPAVLVAACTSRGELRGQQVSGVARVLSGSAADEAKRLIHRKYRAGWAIATTWWFIQSALHLGRRRSTPVFLEITPR